VAGGVGSVLHQSPRKEVEKRAFTLVSNTETQRNEEPSPGLLSRGLAPLRKSLLAMPNVKRIRNTRPKTVIPIGKWLEPIIPRLMKKEQAEGRHQTARKTPGHERPTACLLSGGRLEAAEPQDSK